jgi:hypothetical protein
LNLKFHKSLILDPGSVECKLDLEN